MPTTPALRTLAADEIRTGGDHLFWTADPSETLSESLRRTGQTAPVLVRDTGDGPELVAGRARLLALRALGRPVLVLMVDAPADLDAGLLYLADNAARPLDDAMRLAALRFFAPLLDRAALAADILPRLGVRPGSKDARLLDAWLDLPEPWPGHLAEGRVPLAAGEVLARLAPADREAAAPLFASLGWSRSNGVNLLTWLFEAGKMTGKPLADLLAESGMADVPALGLSPKDAMARLVALARQTRYPALSALQAEFEETARELSAGTAWRVVQPNNFETGGAELTIQVKTPAQLARAVDDLDAMAAKPGWEKLWNMGGRRD
ncbi:ParB N-terminal domain-containing protein [Pseudodesulfovibrio sp.]|uniref:ParB N-terminal domain-containing protein n=1 Tax=Pseudodesulfovibrio sp. TaxID=2035812 RepID=UPI002615E85A|nr:ParB N-terminal domain-containing protein [Pseudodesulfovibrio sp.]MDD3313466.1 ParB N-terminal domain-containing protein [Pseudodesulfovibrio sp.]